MRRRKTYTLLCFSAGFVFLSCTKDDWEKIRLVLGDNQKAKEEHQFIKCEENTAGEAKRLFGDKHPLGDYGIKPRYVINENAFKEIEAYRGIYQPSAAQVENA